MYNKFLVVASKNDPAAVNICSQLNQFRRNPFLTGMSPEARGFDFYLIDDDVLHEENLDMGKIEKYDFVVFASKHESTDKEKALTVHTPGNPREEEPIAGGKRGKISRGSGVFLKQIYNNLRNLAYEHHLSKDYKVTMEATHHGPLIDKPCIFIEIGATKREWEDKRAGFVLAKTISRTVENFEFNPYNEVAVGIGGPHYCPGFNKLQRESNVAISHVIPKYCLPVSEEIIKEAWNKTEEDPEFVVLDWKGLGPKEQRDEIIEILERNYIPWKKRNEIRR
ncbi:MAG: D-aminoacyl-tRNA deacylase [Candidatus Pacearchaeota archaeon]